MRRWEEQRGTKKSPMMRGAIGDFFVNMYLGSTEKEPEEIILDVDVTDDPVHGEQEGRFFHGSYDCYCYLPLYIFSGSHLKCAKLRVWNIDPAEGVVRELERIIGRIREKWAKVRTIVRGDSGFCREEVMSWCEGNGVDYVFEIARNTRLLHKLQVKKALFFNL